jgi:hypothetical protein
MQGGKRTTQSQRGLADIFNVSRFFVEARLSHYRRSGGDLVGSEINLNDMYCLMMVAENNCGSGCLNSRI